jgi:2-dehydro-3-deoxyphosphogluconate aldolase/(4S)-4-hydroxy-2-oxoglutarate aldolase
MSGTDNAFAVVAEIGVIPVITIESVDHAIPLADALLEGGLRVAEITFRTAAAAEVLAILRDKRPELLIGAGTILTSNAIRSAIDGGATFGLAPGFDQTIIDTAQIEGLPFAPGIMTPSDLSAVARNGLRLAKFFPATAAGGPSMLLNIIAPFAHLGIRFIPTGGVTLATLPDWLKIPSVAAVGGTWIAKPVHMREGRWAEITAEAKSAVETVRRIRG